VSVLDASLGFVEVNGVGVHDGLASAYDGSWLNRF
jgi:hypothetical protein